MHKLLFFILVKTQRKSGTNGHEGENVTLCPRGRSKPLPYRRMIIDKIPVLIMGIPPIFWYWFLNCRDRLSLRFGHARPLTPHCGIIHYPRAASLRRPLQIKNDMRRRGGYYPPVWAKSNIYIQSDSRGHLPPQNTRLSRGFRHTKKWVTQKRYSFFYNSVCKPGSVENGHQSSLTVTDKLRVKITRATCGYMSGKRSDHGVASDRVYSKPMLP